MGRPHRGVVARKKQTKRAAHKQIYRPETVKSKPIRKPARKNEGDFAAKHFPPPPREHAYMHHAD